MKIFNVIQIIDGDVSLSSSVVSFADARKGHADAFNAMSELPSASPIVAMSTYDEWLASNDYKTHDYITDVTPLPPRIHVIVMRAHGITLCASSTISADHARMKLARQYDDASGEAPSDDETALRNFNFWACDHDVATFTHD